MINILKIGDVAPNFILPDQNGNLISLKNFIGKKILIYFYPKAFTPGCTMQASYIRDHLEELKKFNLIILGISTDKIKTLALFAEKKTLNFTLLSDTTHEVCKKYSAWIKKNFIGKFYYGTQRISYLIDKNLRIEYIFNNFKVYNHHNIIINYLKFNK